ncbi:Hypothetical_protein [Hexamita inflata]|uniref:Hypothetical_protein n=1 Tax=Hexamita inflata TaxID=28002 RepID=A0AA86R7M6_9EUKA|nr:Hypothetical protein HINF_LOCUS2015 [Hexamita inflata]CAI9922059.1 Hypothetical protein HINF_LOCUS9704 [Hexamita inflata]CAI9924753.1 Hypothetical protein HINF_LOCUS12398 [Hexamita inflata]CAI9937276.1 Hypothetical protein HINF_LOCUS24921 [Hexamita inflata]CAI9937879.1 Hypothetical protein HINF_LOCUS25524 [Hexamita inflata]
MKWKWKIISKITVVLEQHQYIIQCWARLTHLIPFFKKQKCIHYLNIENESDCNYLNYNSNQAKYQYFILSSRLRLKKKSSIVFRDQEIPKIVQIDPVEDEHRGPLQVQCLRYQLQITYCVRIPIIGSSYSFLQSGLTTIYFRDKIFHKLVLLTKTQKLHRDILNK